MTDPNKFEHAGQTAEGCGTGLHLYETDPSMPGAPLLVADGTLTKMVVHCKRCGAQHELSAPLGLNDVISRVQQGPPPVVSHRAQQPIIEQAQQPQQPVGPSADEVTRKLFG